MMSMEWVMLMGGNNIEGGGARFIGFGVGIGYECLHKITNFI